MASCSLASPDRGTHGWTILGLAGPYKDTAIIPLGVFLSLFAPALVAGWRVRGLLR